MMKIWLAVLLGASVCGNSHAATNNIAIGKPYQLEPFPNYTLCTEAGDSVQLTDDKRVDGLFWGQPGCVGWSGHSPVVITIDLQTNEPIAGVAFNTASSASAGVGWPSEIYVLVSDDGETWYDSGDLIALSARHSLPPPVSQNARHRFETTELAIHGRFVKFIVVPTESYAFVDEIEILRGSDSLLRAKRKGPVSSETPKYKAATKLDSFVRRRLNADLTAVRNALSRSQVIERPHAKLKEELESIAIAIPGSRVADPGNFRTIFPMNEVHGRIFAAQAAIWRANGFKGVVTWPAKRWDMLSPTEPPQRAKTKVDVSMMQNEFRSAAFNLSNASEHPARVSLTIEGLPGGKSPGWITVHEIPFTDTHSGVAVASALPVIKPSSGHYSLQIPSGMTRQVWLTFHSKDVKPVEYTGKIVVNSSRALRGTTIPLRVKVYPLTFPDQPTLSLCGWDYTDGERTYYATPQNRSELIRYLREHFVDTPWAQTTVMPPGKYDATGKMIEPPSVEAFRTWVNRWRNARNYFVFSNLGETFGGLAMGTPEFKRAVTGWINWWAGELRKMNVQPRQLGLLIVDEPRESIHDRIMIEYARVIRAAQPDVVIFNDPIWDPPTKGDPGMYQLSTILCPNLPLAIQGGKSYLDFFLKYREAGHPLWFYSCHGFARLLDPYSYYRMQQWFCWKHRAEGAGFWSFTDTREASSWNEYLTANGAFCPLFLDENTVTGAKEMEAMREGVEDYEYLRMLRDRVESLEKGGVKNETVAAARRLLDTAADRVVSCMASVNQIYWSAAKDREVADEVRMEILEALQRLN
jgi:hypothetical protein